MQNGTPQTMNKYDLHNKNIMFLSDTHLGAPDEKTSGIREKKLVETLQKHQSSISHLVLVGDIFDCWYEYKKAVPKGFVRLLGQLAQMADEGVQIHYFIGNHDLWLRDYFEQEMNAMVYREPSLLQFDETKFYIGHGDGFPKSDGFYRFIKKLIYTNPICKWMFRQLPVDIGLGLAQRFSASSRTIDEKVFVDGIYEQLKTVYTEIDARYFIFGHVHQQTRKPLGENKEYINLGEWFSKPHYAIFDNQNINIYAVQ